MAVQHDWNMKGKSHPHKGISDHAYAKKRLFCLPITVGLDDLKGFFQPTQF